MPYKQKVYGSKTVSVSSGTIQSSDIWVLVRAFPLLLSLQPWPQKRASTPSSSAVSRDMSALLAAGGMKNMQVRYFCGLSLRLSGFSCVLVSPCKARERGPDPLAVAGSAWSAGASGSGFRLETFRLYWELRSSVTLARRADRGWRSRCCTSFLQTALWTHTQPSAFPKREREQQRLITQEQRGGWTMSKGYLKLHWNCVINHVLGAAYEWNELCCMQVKENIWIFLWWILTDPYSSPLLFIPRYNPLSTPRMLTIPTARLMNSNIPVRKSQLLVPSWERQAICAPAMVVLLTGLLNSSSTFNHIVLAMVEIIIISHFALQCSLK